MLTTKDNDEDEAYPYHPRLRSLTEMVASARNKMESLGLQMFWLQTIYYLHVVLLPDTLDNALAKSTKSKR